VNRDHVISGVNNGKIAKLEVLLNRVVTRASAPRTLAASAFSPVSSARAPEAISPPVSYPDLPAPPTSSLPPPAQQLNANAVASDDALTADASDIEVDELFDSDIEVTADEVEVDVDVDVYDEVRPATESGAQLVAAPPERAAVAPTPTSSASAPFTEAASTETQMPPLVPEAREANEGEAAIEKAEKANEIQEEAPTSSRRPVTAETTTAAAYEAEAYEANEESGALRLTPPPESGRHVATPPIESGAEPGARQSPTAPPPAGYGATGGWREPGVPTGPGFDLRGPTKTAVTPTPPAPPLAPEHINPELPMSIDVVDLTSTTQAFKPANFGDLLDATLSL